MAARAHIDRKFFFDNVRRSVFGGTLTPGQVENLEKILEAVESYQITNPFWIGAVLSTVRTEVGNNMAPVREGFKKTDAAARAYVTSLFKAGTIKTNYGKIDPVTGKSYYGRGYGQITHYENYAKLGAELGLDLVNNPDALLEPYIAAKALVVGMQKGLFRAGKSLQSTLGTFPEVPSRAQMVNSRDIINGDKNKKRGKVTIGNDYADYLVKFAAAVQVYFDAPEFEEAPKPVDTPAPQVDNTPEIPRGFWQKTFNYILYGEFK